MESLQKLHTFCINNNVIRDGHNEIEKISHLADLKNVFFSGNPVYTKPEMKENWPMVLSKIPQVESIDGEMVTEALRAEAEALE